MKPPVSVVAHPLAAIRVLVPVLVLVGCARGTEGDTVPSVNEPRSAKPELERTRPDESPSATVRSDASAKPDTQAAGEARAEAESVRSEIRDKHVVIADDIQPGLAAFARAVPRRGCLWTGRLSGNGDRDVLIFVPPGADNEAQTRLVYHFHGTYSEHLEQQRPGLPKKKWVGWNRLQQTVDAVTELQEKRDHNVALVYPLSAGKRREPGLTGWNNRAYDRMWMHPTDQPEYKDSFNRLHEEALQVLAEHCGVHPKAVAPKVVAEGHSAGGIALRNIALSDTEHVGEYIFLDASFQSWADGAWQAIREHDRDALVTMVVTEDGIADPYGRRDPWCERLPQQAAAFEVHRRFCGQHPAQSPPGVEAPCEVLQKSAEEWPDYEQWCAATRDDMKTLPGVYLHRTGVYHGEQPRRFAGGLNLPADRLEADRRDAAEAQRAGKSPPASR